MVCLNKHVHFSRSCPFQQCSLVVGVDAVPGVIAIVIVPFFDHIEVAVINPHGDALGHSIAIVVVMRLNLTAILMIYMYK